MNQNLTAQPPISNPYNSLCSSPEAGPPELLDAVITDLLYSAEYQQQLTPALEASIRSAVDALAGALDPGRAVTEESQKLFHRILYRIYTSQYQVPWEYQGFNIDEPIFYEIRRKLESMWEARERARAQSLLDALPPVEDFPAWATELVHSHASGVSHPLFAFLREKATYEQLREFHRQETPFDIFFSDILTFMMPGVYGVMRTELAQNYWDEMGRGEEAQAHRMLRIRMMQFLGIPERMHLDAVEDYAWEEIALANLYFQTAMNRSSLGQAVGVMLATETAVPGRIDCQLEGCRRVGMPEDKLEYLAVHTVIDVEHAAGWMNEVVMPMLRQREDFMGEIVFGMFRRLEAAKAVCDRMLAYLPTL